MTKLQEMLQFIKNEHVYIQTHNFPDPDAIASAYGLHYLLQKKGIYSTICYIGDIDRHSTLRMIHSLNIPIVNINYLYKMSDKDEIILVDSQKGNSNLIHLDGNEVICIDHHQTFEDAEYCFADIRPQVGACSSIIAQYFIDNKIEMTKEVATALLYGIKIDTANLCRGVDDLDLDMHYYLYRQSDLGILQKLEHSTLQISDLSAYVNAINSIQVYDKISFANTGKNCPEALIANISDFMMSIVDVHVSVVYSVRENGIKLSARSKIPSFDVGKMCNKVLGDYGSGGGHSTMAGGFIPVNSGYKECKDIISNIERNFIKVFGEIEKRNSRLNPGS